MQVMPIGQRRHVFGLFATLERSLSILDLSAIFQTYQQLLEPFTKTVLGLLGNDVFPVEFQLVQYLLAPNEVLRLTGDAANSFLDAPFIAWPIYTLLQAWYFLLSARRYGWPALTGLFCGNGDGRSSSRIGNTGGLLALGKGIFAMLAVSEAGESGEALFPEKVAKYMRGAYGVGRSLYIHHELHRRAGVPAAPFSTSVTNLLVVNISTPVLQHLVNVINNDSSGGSFSISALQVARVVTRRAAVVTGHPADLTRLQIALSNFSSLSGVKVHIDVLPATTPENSHFFNDAIVLEVLRMWADLGFTIEPNALLLSCHLPGEPLLALGGGSKINAATIDSQALMRYLAATAVSSTQSVIAAFESFIGSCDTFLLDFNAARLNVGQLVAWSYSTGASAVADTLNEASLDTVVISLPSDKTVSSILPTPKRSGQALAIRSSLQKCAILNTLLAMVKASSSGEEVKGAEEESGEGTSFRCGDATFMSVGLVERAGSSGADEGRSATRLTVAGASFTRFLLESTSIAFPVDVLLTCPDVLSLLEMWEVLEMTGKKCRPGNGQLQQQVIRTVGGPGVLVLSSATSSSSRKL